MEIIRERDIDFNTLTKLNCRINSESRLFHDKEVLYKIYKKTEFRVLRRKEKKIKLLNDGNKFDNVIVPDKIVLGGFFNVWLWDGLHKRCDQFI